MTEEVVQPVVEEAVEDKQPSAKEVTEQRAREQNWMPEEEWAQAGNDPTEWRSAREFLDRGELFGVIHATRRELTQTKQALSALHQHYQKVYESAHKDALKQLKDDRREAIRESDFERVDQLDTQIEQKQEEIQEVKQAGKQPQAQQGPTPEFQQFLGRNPWFAKDVRMQRFAIKAGEDFLSVNPGAPPEVVFSYMEKETKETFVERFKPQRRVNPVDGGGSEPVARSSGGLSVKDLTDDERKVMNSLVKSKVLTKEEYLADLQKVR